MSVLHGPAARRVLLGAVPDEPERVDVRGLLARPSSQAVAHPSGCWGCVRDEAAAIVGVYGAVPADVLREAVLAPQVSATPLDLFALLPEAEGVRAALGAAHERGGSLFVLPREVRPRAGHATSLLGAQDGPRLEHVPEPLRAELVEAARCGPLAVGLDGGRPVSFCYAHHATSRWWDVSVDTLESHRRRGFAASAAAALIDAQRGRGLEPVWGALDENGASGGLALRLGFVERARFVVFSPAAR